MKVHRHTLMILAVFMLLTVFSCRQDYTPKPRGFVRIDIPAQAYRDFDTNFPYYFQYPVYAEIVAHEHADREPYWINIVYPQFNGQIYISYKKIDNNLVEYLEDSRSFVMKHIPKASSIDDTLITDRDRNVFGMIYYIHGTGAASPCQFFVTDSSTHFLRGALYFNFTPDNDSLAPVIDLIEKDIRHLVSTVRWR